MNSPDVPLHQTGTGLETTLIPAWIVPNTFRLPTANPLDVLVGVDSCRGAGSRRRLGQLILILGGKRRRGRCRRCLRRASCGMRVAGEVAVVPRVRGRRVGA